MSLNEKMEFSSVSDEVKRAFLETPDKIFLKPGTKLYKYTDYPLIDEKGEITAW
jgi:protein-L-isoaspartate O-methyltransferase